MSRVPVTLRMLLLLPLLAAGVDLTRATAACGAGAQTCLEAAGRGWLGPVAVLLVVAYAAGAGLLVARAARRRDVTGAPMSFGRLWLLGTAGLVLASAGQDALAQALGGQAPLGGSPLGVLALCAVGGALLALALRVADDAVQLVADLQPGAPRLVTLLAAAVRGERPRLAYVRAAERTALRGRAPPFG